jgi:hypothetical protein
MPMEIKMQLAQLTGNSHPPVDKGVVEEEEGEE